LSTIAVFWPKNSAMGWEKRGNFARERQIGKCLLTRALW